MTEINLTPAESAKPVKISLNKLTDGIGIVFMGVLTMLEAMEASGRKRILDSLDQEDTLEKKADAPGEAAAPDGATGSDVAEADGVSSQVVTGDPEGDSIPANDPAKAPDSTTDSATDGGTDSATDGGTDSTSDQPNGLTVDDVTNIVVQKIKTNPGINDKIRALVIAHGAQRVSELKPEVLEAFLTDLSQL